MIEIFLLSQKRLDKAVTQGIIYDGHDCLISHIARESLPDAKDLSTCIYVGMTIVTIAKSLLQLVHKII